MKDRNVQFPMRYLDKITGNVMELEALPGNVIEVGSIYNKANVLPENVCKNLGLNHITAEPKDAFAMVASGRYYGKVSEIANSQLVGYSGAGVNDIARCENLVSNDFGNITSEPDGKYSKIYVPAGAKKVKLTMTSQGAKNTFGSCSATLKYVYDSQENDVIVQSSGGANAVNETTTTSKDVNGSGSEYFYVQLLGEENKSGDRGNRKLISLMLEVIK